MTAIGVAAALVWGVGLQATGLAGSMTTERRIRRRSRGLPINERSVAFEDITARARIREAALEHFARGRIRACDDPGDCQDRRRFTRTAPAPLRIEGSPREACDDYVFEILQRVNAKLLEDPSACGKHPTDIETLRTATWRGRSQTDLPPAGPIFDEMVTMTEHGSYDADESRVDVPAIDRRIRAALVTAMAVGFPLLHEHVSRVLGTDMFGPEGDRLVASGATGHLLPQTYRRRDRYVSGSRLRRALVVSAQRRRQHRAQVKCGVIGRWWPLRLGRGLIRVRADRSARRSGPLLA